MIQTARRTADGATDWVGTFERLLEGPLAGAPAWLVERRRAAIDTFAEEGYPSTRLEDWRYTSVARLTRTAFTSPLELDAPALSPEEYARLAPPPIGPAVHRLVFVDGILAPELSSPPPADEDGLLVAPLGGAPDRVEAVEHLGRIAPAACRPFVALNTALFSEGALIRVARAHEVAEPIHLVFVATTRQAPQAVHPRVLVCLEESARATVVETHTGPDDAIYLTNAVTELDVGPGAACEHVRVQVEGERAFHLATMRARLGRDASLRSLSLSLGAGLARNAIEVAFEQPGASCDLSGLYVADGERHTDLQISVDHAVPHCTSSQDFRGILDGKARGVFNGGVLVRPDAQKTDARQTNANLLLSRRATVDAKPQLEIHADDVKCSHGATIGQLDERAVFYLRSRGIDEVHARGLLTRAFAQRITDGLRLETLRGWVGERLERKLTDEAACGVRA